MPHTVFSIAYFYHQQRGSFFKCLSVCLSVFAIRSILCLSSCFFICSLDSVESYIEEIIFVLLFAFPFLMSLKTVTFILMIKTLIEMALRFVSLCCVNDLQNMLETCCPTLVQFSKEYKKKIYLEYVLTIGIIEIVRCCSICQIWNCQKQPILV
jgi:hypothetical protein